MGQKNKKKQKKMRPFVSICTPTFNRRPFIPYMIKCFEHQKYPKERMEWIIIDDGTDKIEELVKDIPQVKYFKYDEKMPLGKKRNIMHEKSKGDIIVYMDDDDYYPPDRVSHAVEMLTKNKKALCAGSSEIYIYFKHIDSMYQFGPYGPNHATAGTFAFKRELLKDHAYENHAALAEEKAFLKNYTVPFVQLNPLKTILVFSHTQNTFDKKELLKNPHPDYVRKSDKIVDMFVKEADMKDFYMNQIDGLLKDYAPGDPKMKPDVLKQIKEISAKREKMAQDRMRNAPSNIVISDSNGQQKNLSLHEVSELLKNQQKTISELIDKLKHNTLPQVNVSDSNGQQKLLNGQEIGSLLKQQHEKIQNFITERHQMQQSLQEAQQSMSQFEFKLFEKERKIEELENKLKDVGNKNEQLLKIEEIEISSGNDNDNGNDNGNGNGNGNDNDNGNDNEQDHANDENVYLNIKEKTITAK
jgi:glycosyltransferase involved in cell wall biosynthesis